MSRPFNVEGYRRLARRRLPRMVFDYLDGGAEDETGMAHNRAEIRALRFAPHRLTDVSAPDLSTTLLGQTIPLPVAIAPTGLNGIFWPKGDLALARAAEAAGIPFLLSTASNMSIEEIAQGSGGTHWFQLYVVQRELADLLVRRAWDSGYRTLVLTTDVAVNGNRERDLRNHFGVPARYTPRTLWDGVTHPRWSMDFLRHGVPQLANFVTAQADNVDAQAAIMSRQMDASFDWDALAHLRDAWKGKLLVKGLCRPEDVAKCAAMGVDGVILSNHGGRQLDGAVAPIEILPAVRALTDIPVLVDSGYRRGEDIIKALCLGADAVLLGRATLYGLAARGQRGVEEVIDILHAEMARTLALIGRASVADLRPDDLWDAASHAAPPKPA